MNKIVYILMFACLLFVSTILIGKEKKKDIDKIETTSEKKENNYLIPSPQVEDDEVNNLLSTFKTYNIGDVTQEGSITVKDSIIEVVASGADFWGTEDEGFFIFQQRKGDFEFSVRVHSLSPVDLYTKAGIMARKDLSDRSEHVYFLVFPNNEERNNNNGGCEFQYRTKRGGDSEAIYPTQLQNSTDDFKVNFPDTWIKLKREGNTFSAFMSNDSISWNRYTSYEQKMPRNMLVGLAVTSHNANGYAKSEFSEIQISEQD